VEENIYPEGWTAYGMDPSASTDAEFMHHFLQHYFSEEKYWQSVVVTMTYRHNAVETIRLYPIDLGRDKAPHARGVPSLAPPAEGVEILQRIQKLSEPFGTRIAIENGVGVIQVAR
jgi:hypothetical protein